MKLFLWEEVDHATERYHPEAGIVVIAESLERARDLLRRPDEYVPSNCGAYTQEPDYTTEVTDTQERVFIFPDAGCC